MNELLVTLGLEAHKPLLTVLLLPPVPLLLLALVGAWQMARRRVLGWTLLLLALTGMWLLATEAVGGALTRSLLDPPRALSIADISGLKRAPNTAIVVLGGGRQLLAPEYAMSDLRPLSVERLRYALWLARETALPVAFSGGLGHGAPAGPSEAEIATRIAEREFGRPLRWAESESRDTRENALRSVALLRPAGIARIVLVTHDFHMRRALANFERAVAATGGGITIVPAPMGLPQPGPTIAGDWLPSLSGQQRCTMALREWFGRLVGA